MGTRFLGVPRIRMGISRIRRGFSFWKAPPPPDQNGSSSPANYEVILAPSCSSPPSWMMMPKVPPDDDGGVSVPDYVLRRSPADAESKSVEPPVVWTGPEVEGIREACRMARRIIRKVPDFLIRAKVKTTEELDRLIHQEVVRINGAYPSLLGFQGFPRSISTSVNNVAVHGIPDSRPLRIGDLLTVDLAVYYGGFHGNCSDTILVTDRDLRPPWDGGRARGEGPVDGVRAILRSADQPRTPGASSIVDPGAARLISAAQECLYAGIGACGPGVPFFKVGKAVAAKARSRGVRVVPNLVGHGIGTFFHGPPDVYHTLNSYPGSMAPGMVFTIEPCVVEGDHHIRVWPEDGITVVTVDGGRAAQFEHTVLITSTGVEILTI